MWEGTVSGSWEGLFLEPGRASCPLVPKSSCLVPGSFADIRTSASDLPPPHNPASPSFAVELLTVPIWQKSGWRGQGSILGTPQDEICFELECQLLLTVSSGEAALLRVGGPSADVLTGLRVGGQACSRKEKPPVPKLRQAVCSAGVGAEVLT